MNAVTPPPISPAKPVKPVLSPIALSALVYPGAGQLMQRRWAVGAFFIAASTVAVIWLVRTVYKVLTAYYGLAFDPMNAPVDVPGVAALMVPFFVWLATFVASIIDTAIASYRQQMRRER